MSKLELISKIFPEKKPRKRKLQFKVSVVSEPVENESDIDNNVFAFTYKVTIENKSNITARLINRHWLVFSNALQIADVKGEGVIGQQPILKPMDKFEYSSWTVLRDPIGSMKGSFTFLSLDGNFFDVQIPEFSLAFKDRLSVH